MIAQMVGAGSLVSLLIPQVSFNAAIVVVGVLMLIYVIFGGMLATTWVQIVKAVLLMAGTILLSILVLARFGFSLLEFFDAGRAASPALVDTARDGSGRMHEGLHAARPALQRAVGRARSDLARHRADLRHRRPAAHPRALLHRAVRAGGAHSRSCGR